MTIKKAVPKTTASMQPEVAVQRPGSRADGQRNRSQRPRPRPFEPRSVGYAALGDRNERT